MACPAAITTTFLGAAAAFQSSLSNELWLVLAAIVTIYIVLGVLYESFIHPMTILSTLPSAAVGALLALMLTGKDLGVIGIIGIILLIGIVKKNAIMMIDFALDAERNEGKDSDHRDPPGGAAALPPDPDDHHGRAAGRRAADARRRHRGGAAPAARHVHRRRPDRLAAADAVHDAGDLHLASTSSPRASAGRDPEGPVRYERGQRGQDPTRGRPRRRTSRNAATRVPATREPEGHPS